MSEIVIEGSKVTCGSQSVEVWGEEIQLYYATEWGESPDSISFDDAEDLIEALKVAVREGRAWHEARERQNAEDELAFYAQNPQYCPSHLGAEAVAAWKERYGLPSYCRAYNAITCSRDEQDRHRRCYCKEDAERPALHAKALARLDEAAQ